ncbi:chaperonin 10-like protein, partial [Clohesyomyces aquaticus]
IDSYPYIPGMEVAGYISAVGSAVTMFKKGDRVAALALSIRTKNPLHGGFQNYTLAPQPLVSRIPSSLPYTQAVVLPLALATAAASLYEPEYLNLPVPRASITSIPSASTSPSDAAIIIWGGSSSVGSCALQLCSPSSLTIFTTASSRNHDYVRDLGADFAFDHKYPDVVSQLIETISSMRKTLVGVYDAIATKDTVKKCAEVLRVSGGGMIVATRDAGVREEELGEGVWEDFMGEGLQNGKLKAKPNAIVLEGGLEKCQEGIDLYRKGVSAAKIVVKIQKEE